MVSFTTNQWAILALVLVLGWLLGLLSRSGGARWRKEAAAERDLRIAAERDRDARLAATRDHEAQLATARARIAELESRPTVAPVAAPIAGSVAPSMTSTVAPTMAAPAGSLRDDLTLIHGIDRSRASRLNDLGVTSFQDIVSLSGDGEATLEGRLGLPTGTIAREEWRHQADLLARGRVDEHRTRWRSI